LERLPFLSEAKVTQMSVNTRTYATSEGVAFSFFGNIGFGRVGEPLMTEDGVLQVASLKDLMGAKLAVMLKRVESKDYRDIAALLLAGIDLHDGLAYAQALYKQFPPLECVRAMVFFNDPELGSLSEEDKGILISAAKKFRPGAVPRVSIVSSELVS